MLPAAAPLTPMAPPQLSRNTAPILVLVGAEILSLLAFVGVCEPSATDSALRESWALALPATTNSARATTAPGCRRRTSISS